MLDISCRNRKTFQRFHADCQWTMQFQRPQARLKRRHPGEAPEVFAYEKRSLHGARPRLGFFLNFILTLG